jgi:hypothetical protein
MLLYYYCNRIYVIENPISYVGCAGSDSLRSGRNASLIISRISDELHGRSDI